MAESYVAEAYVADCAIGDWQRLAEGRKWGGFPIVKATHTTHSNDFERPLTAEHELSSGFEQNALKNACFQMLSNTKKRARSAISSFQASKQALAVISSARWLPSTPEQ